MNLILCLVEVFLLFFILNVDFCNAYAADEGHTKRKETSAGFQYSYIGQKKEFTCNSSALYHQWYQHNIDSTTIGTIPLQNGSVYTSRLILTVEEFDRNTVIKCAQKSLKNKSQYKSLLSSITAKTWNKLDQFLSIYKTQIRFYNSDKTVDKWPIETIEINSTTHKYYFNCEDNEQFKIHTTIIGFMNTTSNLLITYNKTHASFNVSCNGSRLCCIYFEVSTNANEATITRHVDKKTLLIFNNPNGRYYSSEKETGDRNELKRDQDQIHIIPYITATVLVVILLLVIVIIIIIYKKRCRKKTNSTTVLYADLQLHDSPGYVPAFNVEESPYAQIIGEMRPEIEK